MHDMSVTESDTVLSGLVSLRTSKPSAVMRKTSSMFPHEENLWRLVVWNLVDCFFYFARTVYDGFCKKICIGLMAAKKSAPAAISVYPIAAKPLAPIPILFGRPQ